MGWDIKRFMCMLEAYIRTPGAVLSKEFLLDLIPYEAAAQHLKELRSASFVHSIVGRFTDEPDFKTHPTPLKIEDVGDIFHPRHWLRWEPVFEEDWDWHMEPIKKPSARDEELYKEALRNMLPRREDFDRVEELEILLQNSSSGSFPDGDPLKKQAQFMLKEKENSFSKSPMNARRTLVFKDPGDNRDAVTLSIKQSNSVKLIEKQVAQITPHLPWSTYGTQLEKWDQMVTDFKKNNGCFFDRDIKKSGITQPRHLVLWTLDVLEEIYPGLPAWKYRGIYDGLTITDPRTGEVRVTTRGHGLGQASAIFTITQVVLFRIIVDELIQQADILEGGIDAIVFHDDMSIGFQSWNDLETYIDYEGVVLDRFGVIRNLKKSHAANEFVFCEVYSNSLMGRKRSYKSMEKSLPYAAVNITEAKSIFLSIQRRFEAHELPVYLEELVAYWGYEFYPEEWREPFIFGGWIAPRYMGVDVSWHEVEIGNPVRQAAACLTLLKHTKPVRHAKGSRLYKDPLSEYLPNVILPEDIERVLNYRQPLKLIKEKFVRLKKEAQSELWVQLRRHRLEDFKKNLKTFKHSMWPMLYTVYSEHHKYLDILPPKFSVKDGRTLELLETDRSTRFPVGNPLLCLIKYFNEDLVADHLIPDPRFAMGKKMNNWGMTAEEMRQAAVSWEMVPDLRRPRESPFITYQDVTVPVEFYKFYNDPQAVMAACETFYGTFRYLPLDGSREVRWDLPDWYLAASQDAELNQRMVSLVRTKGWEYCKNNQHELLEEITYTIPAWVPTDIPEEEEERPSLENLELAHETWVRNLDYIENYGLQHEGDVISEEEVENFDNDIFAEFETWDPVESEEEPEPAEQQVQETEPDEFGIEDFWRWVSCGRPDPSDSLEYDLWTSFVVVYAEQNLVGSTMGLDSMSRVLARGLDDENTLITEAVRNAAFPSTIQAEEAEDSPDEGEDDFGFDWDELGGG
jgi:hypothetical protein